MHHDNRKGVISAAIHIIDCEMKMDNADPATAMMIAINALSREDQTLIAQRMIQVLKEQEVKLSQK